MYTRIFTSDNLFCVCLLPYTVFYRHFGNDSNILYNSYLINKKFSIVMNCVYYNFLKVISNISFNIIFI